MVDIIDVLLAKKLSNDGKADAAVRNAEKAVVAANKAAEEANAVLESLEGLDFDEEIGKLNFGTQNEDNEEESAVITNLVTSYPDTTQKTTPSVVKMYKQSGENEDGTMTQKAIKAAIAENGGSIDLGEENEGKVVLVSEEGKPVASAIDSEDLIDALIKTDYYNMKDVVGLYIDYRNKTFTRKQEAEELTAGEDFNKYPMFGGRKQCIVNDEGEILAFYGDANWNTANGQIMVYQPKFYYQRTPMKTEDIKVGKLVREELLLLSTTKYPGFKLHPLFKAEDGTELDYVLLSAYEGSVWDASEASYGADIIDYFSDKLSSVRDVKPISGAGSTGLNVQKAEQLAQNRGDGWHITNMAVESAMQMLGMVEFGMMNGQEAIGDGVVDITSVEQYNCASLTGSTEGNDTMVAEETLNEVNGNLVTYSEPGKVAISYRGVENPWGNLWRLIGGCNLYGNGSYNGGLPQICPDYNYSDTMSFEDIGFCIPSVFSWISAMGYGNEKYDWVYMPAECNGNANSVLPVGDNLWSISNLNATNQIVVGGGWSFKENAGPFYYGCDKEFNQVGRNFGARLMFVPQKNEVYEKNIAAWQRIIGG